MRKLIITAAMLLASSVALAQAPVETDPSEVLRRGTAEGAAYCKANLASAPGDLKVGEIEAFCSCMGVNEYAMKSMDDATKAMLRPRQQQTCIASLRKDAAPAQAAVPSPLPAVAAPAPVPAPVLPSSPPVATPAAAPVAGRADRLPFEGTWRLRVNNDCSMAETFTKYALIEHAGGETVSISKILKVERRNEMVYNLTVRVEDTLGHGLPTVNRIMRLEIENESAMNGTGSYFKDFNRKTAEYVRCPDIAVPKEAAALAAGAAPARPAIMAAAPPREPAKPACGGSFEAQYAKTRQRERQIAGEMGHHMQWTPRAFWNFCALERERLALAQRTLSQVKACPSAPSAKIAQRASLDTIQRVNRFINRPGCA